MEEISEEEYSEGGKGGSHEGREGVGSGGKESAQESTSGTPDWAGNPR